MQVLHLVSHITDLIYILCFLGKGDKESNSPWPGANLNFGLMCKKAKYCFVNKQLSFLCNGSNNIYCHLDIF